MKAKQIKIINLIVAVLVALFAIGQAFAWLATGSVYLRQGFGGSSAGAYFAYGDGSEKHPFGINTKYHMYNLAWLQNTGRLIDSSEKQVKYYFELDPDMEEALNMGDMWLPPIGNDENPFMGEFNGNGKTLTNLRITTDKSRLTANPASANYEFSNAVGMFGMTAEGSEVANFILTNPIVEAASSDTKYATEWSGEEGDTHSKRVIGLAVGHVAGKCYSVGIRATETGAQTTTLDVNRTGYSTFNSILGELAPGVTSSVTGGGYAGGTPGGSGGNFGNTFDVSILYSRLENIALAKYGYKDCRPGETLTPNSAAWKLPSLSNQIEEWEDAGNAYWTLAAGEKLAFVKTGDHYTDDEPYEEVAKDSTGYFLGNQTKISKKTLTFAKPLTRSADGSHYYAKDAEGNTGSPYELGVTPAWLYTQPNSWTNTEYQTQHGFAPVNQATFDNLPDGIKKLIDFKPGDSGSFTAVREPAVYTQTVPAPGRWQTLNEQSWSYHGQITWNGNTYGRGIRSDQLVEIEDKLYNAPADSKGYIYTYDGYPTDDNKYKLNDDYSYVIDIDGWNTPVFALNSNGQAVMIKGGNTFSYYTDGNLIDENNYLFNFEGDERRYVSALEGWALPIYDVDANGYALDENGNRYSVNAFYTLDDNGFYKRANGTYVIKTPGWETPIYVVDENGYALTEAGGKYYTTTVGVYQIDGTCKFYDEDGNALVLVDGQYIRPYGFDDDGYAVTASGLYYTSTADSYLKLEDGVYYRVDENGNKQIDDNGRIVTPFGFDNDGYAVNEEGYYYNSKDTNIFYDKRGNKYYQISISANAGNIWTYVINGSAAVVTKIDDNGYAMNDDNLYFTSADNVYVDVNGYTLQGDGGYIMDTEEFWQHNEVGSFANGEFLAAADNKYPQYVKGKYYTDMLGYAITTTGGYALDAEGNTTGDKILYGVNSNGELIYSSGPHAGQLVTIAGNYQNYSFKSIHTDAWYGYKRIQVNEGDSYNLNLAKAITGSEKDRIKQAEGTLEDRVQATHDSEFQHDHVMVKAAEGYDRPKGVIGDVGPFHQMIGGIFLPNNGIWFKPAQSGMIRFVMWADIPSQNFVLLKIERQLHADGTVSFDDTIIKVDKVLQQQLPANCMFYYEYEVSDADIEAGNVEFIIMRDGNVGAEIGGSFLLYLDVGASALIGGDDPIDIGAIDMEKHVSAIDFIYEGVEIHQGEAVDDILRGDFIIQSSSPLARYENSKTSVYFENIEQVLRIVFVRLYSQPDDTTIQVTITSDSPDEVKATHDIYVVGLTAG